VRGRALEMLLTGEDISGVSGGALRLRQPRAARRRAGPIRGRHGQGAIAGFDKQAIAAIKRLVDIPTLPSDIEIGAEWALS